MRTMFGIILLLFAATLSARAQVQPGAASSPEQLRKAILEHDAVMFERDPKLVAEKYSRMTRTPFAFFRGTAWLDADTSARPGVPDEGDVALVGDPHPENIAVVENLEGKRVLEFNDFDLAGYGSYRADLRRAAVGFWIAADMGKLKRKQRAKVVEALVDGYLAEARALGAAEAPAAISAAGLFGERTEAVLVHGSSGGELGKPATTAEAALAAAALGQYTGGPRKLALGHLRVYSKHAGIASYPLLRLRVVGEELPRGGRGPRLIEIKEASGASARLVTEVEREFDRPIGVSRDLGWAIVDRREFRLRRVLLDERRFSAEGIARELKSRRATKDELRELAFRSGRLLALGHCTAARRDGSPGLAAVLKGIASRRNIGDEVVSEAELVGEANKANAKAFRDLITRYGPTLGWRQGVN